MNEGGKENRTEKMKNKGGKNVKNLPQFVKMNKNFMHARWRIEFQWFFFFFYLQR